MNLGYLLAGLFEKLPEWPIKNKIRCFAAFNKHIPKFISDVVPLKGYELHYHLKPGDIVVDAGAFTGDYTIFAAKKVGANGKIIAFEPDKKNRERLLSNIKYEKLNNVIVIPKGLWSEDTFLSIEKSRGLHTAMSKEKTGDKIEVARLDNELKKLKIKKVDFIKMDIEGAEKEAMKGCVKTLKENKLNLAIASYHIVDGEPTSIFLEKFLKKAGYKTKSNFQKHLTTYAWKD